MPTGQTLFPFGDSLGKPVNIETAYSYMARTNLNDSEDLGLELFEDNVYLPYNSLV